MRLLGIRLWVENNLEVRLLQLTKSIIAKIMNKYTRRAFCKSIDGQLPPSSVVNSGNGDFRILSILKFNIF